MEKTETACRVRGRIESVLDWCTVRGYRKATIRHAGTAISAEVLPARGQVAKVEHHAALSYRGYRLHGRAARARRRRRTRAGIRDSYRRTHWRGDRRQWAEIDLGEKTWTVPAGRMKGGKEHKVPLRERAIELLRALPTEDGNGFVFLGPRGGSGLSNMAMTQVLKRMNRGDITVHGFRSSFRDWASETTNFPNHVVEMALAHVVGDKVEAAYRRGDLLVKRRQLAEAWSKYCTSPPPAGAVLPMRRPA